jgi:hypothetical protein
MLQTTSWLLVAQSGRGVHHWQVVPLLVLPEHATRLVISEDWPVDFSFASFSLGLSHLYIVSLSASSAC